MSLIKRVKRRLLGYTSDELINELRRNGAKIGKGVFFFDVNSTVVDVTRPWLLNIGEYTKITRGCVILTHDYSLSVLRRKYGEWIGEGAETIIGTNCFIGINSVILMGSKIGDNVVIGAGSVVHGEIPSNVVVAGNPARIICSLDEYHDKRIERTKKEAIECARVYYESFGCMPEPAQMSGFKFILFERDKDFLTKHNISFSCHGDEPKEIESFFYKTEPFWNNYNDFLNAVRAEIEKKIKTQ